MDWMRPIPFLALAAIALSAPLARAEEPPVVVELFTSQGCNSCPPADAYLGELAKRPGVLALAFHVDYWNYIGWTDPFGRPWASARQRDYMKSLNQRFVYTPQIVVDGMWQGVGSEREKVEMMIKKAQANAGRARPTLSVRRREDGGFIIEIGRSDNPPEDAAVLWLAGFDQPHTTKVLRGENEGRTLTDYQIVHSWRRLGSWIGWAMEIVVPPNDAAALGDGGVAALLQEDGDGAIITAARLDMPAR